MKVFLLAYILEAILTPSPHVLLAEPQTSPTPPDHSVELLPLTELFSPFIADPKESRFTAQYFYNFTGLGGSTTAVTSVGDYFPLIQWNFEEAHAAQVGIEGSVYGLFNRPNGGYDLVNTDYFIAFPFIYQSNDSSYRLRLSHQSSHLGDDLLLDNPEQEHIDHTFEDLEFTVAHQWDSVRLYGSGGFVVHSKDDIHQLHFQGGAEYRKPLGANLQLILAADLQSWEEMHWRLDQSYQTGIGLRGHSHREFRAMIGYYNGSSPYGQFYTDDIEYWMLGVSVDI